MKALVCSFVLSALLHRHLVPDNCCVASIQEALFGTVKAEGWGTSVGVVPSDSAFGGDEAFAGLMDQLMPEDSGSDDTASTATSSSSPPPSSSSQSRDECASKATASADAEPAKRSRKRRKHELDHLRGVAAALEKKLKALSEARADKPGGKYFWKRVSNQLMLEKQKAVGENARLREIVRDQVKVVKSLQRSLAKSPDLRVRSVARAACGVTQSA